MAKLYYNNPLKDQIWPDSRKNESIPTHNQVRHKTNQMLKSDDLLPKVSS